MTAGSAVKGISLVSTGLLYGPGGATRIDAGLKRSHVLAESDVPAVKNICPVVLASTPLNFKGKEARW